MLIKKNVKSSLIDSLIYSLSIFVAFMSLTLLSAILILLFKGENLIVDALIFALIMSSIVGILSALAKKSEVMLRMLITYTLTVIFLYIILLSPPANIPSDKSGFIAMFIGSLMGLLISKGIVIKRNKEKEKEPLIAQL